MMNTSPKNFFKVSCAILVTSLTSAPFLLPFLLPSRAIASPVNSQSTNYQATNSQGFNQKIAQLPQDWQTGVRLLRLLDNNGNFSSIGLLLDVANKPTTKYANAVYQLYVKRAGEWREVYTNSGARLLNKNAGRYLLPVEVISLDRLSERISLDDIYNGDLKAITSIRYDLPNGVKDASFLVEEIKSFVSIPSVRTSDAIAGRNLPTATTTAIISSSAPNTTPSTTTAIYSGSTATVNTSAPNTTTPTTTAVYSNNSNNSGLSDRDLGISNTGVSNNSQSSAQNSGSQITTSQVPSSQTSMQPILVSKNNDNHDEDEAYDGDNKPISTNRSRQEREGVELSNKNPHRGHFSLAVLQSQPLQSQSRLSAVVARLSIKSKRPKGFIEERFVGDYQFAINQRATFIRGLNAGDRLIVRLFDLQNRPLGYSEVQLLKDFANISLLLPSDPSAYGLLRTVSGIDSQRIGQIDQNGKFYDYFTQIQNSSAIAQTTVRFLTSSQGIPLNLFNITGLPQAPSQFSYTNAFAKGNNSLSDRVINVFTRNMPPVMQVLPSQLTALIPINDTQSTFDVVRKILDYKDIRPNGISTFF